MRLINLDQISDNLTDKLGVSSVFLAPHGETFFDLKCYNGPMLDAYIIPAQDILKSVSDDEIVEGIVRVLRNA